MPTVFRCKDGSVFAAQYVAPIVSDSKIPALLGLDTLREMRALIDCATNEVHFRGPGMQTIELPPGTQTIQGELSETGHLMLPCSDYDALQAKPNKLDQQVVTLPVVTSAEQQQC